MSSEFIDVDEPTGAGPVTIEAPEPQTGPDPEAPYGRFGNGRPRKSPPGGKKPRAPRAAPAPKPRPRSSAGGAPRKAAAPDFRAVVQEGIALLSIPLMGMGRMNRAFLADAAALQLNAEPLAHALNEVARINPGVSRLLSTTAPAVPYVLLGSALFNLGAQIAANHGRNIPLPGVTVVSPEDLAAGVEAQMGEALRQQQDQEAADRAQQQDWTARQQAGQFPESQVA
jgi:hypothetical protein